MNTFEIEILEDGTVKIESEEFSESKHVKADEFLSALTEAIGGKVVTSQKPHKFWKNRIVQRGGKVVKLNN